MKKFVCTVCGYIYEGESAPEVCPVCKVSGDKFEEIKSDRKWADEHRIGIAQGVDEKVVEDLRANFVGECSEVGMYLAMSRQADREGYPEVADVIAGGFDGSLQPDGSIVAELQVITGSTNEIGFNKLSAR